MRTTILILLNIIVINSWAVNGWEEFSVAQLSKMYERVSNFYLTSDAYYFTINHSSYSDSLTVNPSESIDGFYFKDGHNFYMDILGSKILQIKENKFTIIQDTKEIMIQEAEDNLQVDILERQKFMAKFIDKIYMNHQANFTELRIHYHSVVPYSYIYMKIDDTGFVHYMTMYFQKEVDWVDNNGVKQSSRPRMEIQYKLRPERVRPTQEILKKNPIVHYSKKNQWRPTPKYNGYKITDLRIKK